MIKTFEQYNLDIDPYGEEKWEDLQIEDRVVVNNNHKGNLHNKKGTIKHFIIYNLGQEKYEKKVFLVYFDAPIVWISPGIVSRAAEFKIPNDHAGWVEEQELQKIDY